MSSPTPGGEGAAVQLAGRHGFTTGLCHRHRVWAVDATARGGAPEGWQGLARSSSTRSPPSWWAVPSACCSCAASARRAGVSRPTSARSGHGRRERAFRSVQRLIERARRASEETCSICGEPGRVRPSRDGTRPDATRTPGSPDGAGRLGHLDGGAGRACAGGRRARGADAPRAGPCAGCGALGPSSLRPRRRRGRARPTEGSRSSVAGARSWRPRRRPPATSTPSSRSTFDACSPTARRVAAARWPRPDPRRWPASTISTRVRRTWPRSRPSSAATSRPRSRWDCRRPSRPHVARRARDGEDLVPVAPGRAARPAVQALHHERAVPRRRPRGRVPDLAQRAARPRGEDASSASASPTPSCWSTRSTRRAATSWRTPTGASTTSSSPRARAASRTSTSASPWTRRACSGCWLATTSRRFPPRSSTASPSSSCRPRRGAPARGRGQRLRGLQRGPRRFFPPSLDAGRARSPARDEPARNPEGDRRGHDAGRPTGAAPSALTTSSSQPPRRRSASADDPHRPPPT